MFKLSSASTPIEREEKFGFTHEEGRKHLKLVKKLTEIIKDTSYTESFRFALDAIECYASVILTMKAPHSLTDHVLLKNWDKLKAPGLNKFMKKRYLNYILLTSAVIDRSSLCDIDIERSIMARIDSDEKLTDRYTRMFVIALKDSEVSDLTLIAESLYQLYKLAKADGLICHSLTEFPKAIMKGEVLISSDLSMIETKTEHRVISNLATLFKSQPKLTAHGDEYGIELPLLKSL